MRITIFNLLFLVLIDFKLYTSVKDLPQDWDQLPVDDIFLKTPFLEALETSSPSNISTYFVGVFSSEMLVGIAIVQHVALYIDDMFRKTSNQFFKRCAKQLITKTIKGNALIVGNLMHTGQHGLFYNSQHISGEEFLQTISKSINSLTKQIKVTHRKTIRIIGFKDYFEEDQIHDCKAFFRREKLYKTKVQPNMIFEVQKDWESRQDYVSALSKKYRSRYRTALKKSTVIQRRELSLSDIKVLSDEIYELYENVSNNAGVNSFKLHKDHFYNLKVALDSNFKLFGYFIEDHLVGFYSLILNNKNLETYFLGYNQNVQQQHQMYLNMLYDMAFYGIENNFEHITFARTAMEIKSSIGAKPHDMYIYLKHTHSKAVNKLLKWIVKYANPIRDWDERHPFKM